MQIFLVFFSLLPAAKAHASLCIGKNSTEPSLLLENATNTNFPDFSLLMRTAKAQASLYIGQNSTELSLS